ncbi:MAG: ATP synthase F1 subunit epsilon [Limnospira sp. PMC 1291.21]|uniref:ATP synthase epsilon chain n=3 Tax=Limnospira TaxID=2596745 RepID=A0A9P1NYV2_9CYAN|nr:MULTISPECIES: ATP synthase F1 subunit epsilon [Limnospira]AMW28912.1 ATP synthase F0F1 subunit epsilon [Arthrospira platensis YZ]EKD11688.1 ATP synthase F1 epsilon subunit [Arthrospira platensis C1]MBD2670677.1 F0F1 ATP synthase subunit epsilon [Arthrospira platensis FACHB-439]MDC0840565.1 ATP synthase F1 subunit epsilon [Limnoraphis robusta]MDY7053776.1 ATP synthase F1 subunit epsilon [Limnospira fusiformis LS22]QJB27278.1 F0F1 ATP synthase subunit epsilon [Limnospira fusiformis SAG 85.79
MTLTVRVIAPDQTVWDDTAQEVILPSTTGQLGILSDHAPLLTALDPGVMRVRAKNEWVTIALMEGFAEVQNNEITVLVNGAEKGANIDVGTAREAYNQAQAAVEAANAGGNVQEQMKAKQGLKRARARLQAAGDKAME